MQIHRFQKCYSFRSKTKNNEVIVAKTFQNSCVTRRLWKLAPLGLKLVVNTVHLSSYYCYCISIVWMQNIYQLWANACLQVKRFLTSLHIKLRIKSFATNKKAIIFNKQQHSKNRLRIYFTQCIEYSDRMQRLMLFVQNHALPNWYNEHKNVT